MTAEQKASLAAIFNEILAMEMDDAQDIYNLECRIARLAKSETKELAKGYSRQRINEQLDELVEILDARVSMQLIEDEQWNPEDGSSRPELEDETAEQTPDGGNTGDSGNSGDNGNNEPAPKLNFFQRIWLAIVNFFKKLFGGKN
jgi:hypothetical protein